MTWMTTAAIGPVQWPQSFMCTTLLDKNFAGVVDDEDRESPVQQTLAVVANFLVTEANLAVMAINQNQFLLESG